MALANYTDLTTSLADWLHRTGLTSQIADFVTLAESEINAELHARPMESDESVTLTISTRTIALPARYIEPISLELVISGQSNESLIYVEPQQLSINAATNAKARPTYWTVNAANIEFGNLSDATYTLKFRMLKGLALATTTTNDIMTAYPGLYLYGALLQAAVWMANDQRIPTWEAMYSRLLKKVKIKEGRSKALTSLRTDHPSARGWRTNIITD